MDRSNVINLVSYPWVQNSKGVRVKGEPVKREVYCHVDSVTGSEFFQGGATGIKPELRFTMFQYDYDGEEIIEYEDKLYTVYRTYKALNDEIELYVERRKGNAN